eukprot:3359446-Amphidinium_carterae.1
MEEDAEPSAKKKKGMGAGTPLSASPALEEPAVGEAASGSVSQDTPASARLHGCGRGLDYCGKQKRGVGRPKKPDVMPAGAREPPARPKVPGDGAGRPGILAGFLLYFPSRGPGRAHPPLGPPADVPFCAPRTWCKKVWQLGPCLEDPVLVLDLSRPYAKKLTKANIKVNLKKTVVLCNGAKAGKLAKKVWRTSRLVVGLPPLIVTTRDLGVDTQWAAWRCPVQRKCVMTFKQTMTRVRSLGVPAVIKTRITKSLYSIGLYGLEIGGMSVERSSPLELLTYAGPAGDPQVTADLNTIRVWQRKLNTGTLEWPLDESMWDTALSKGRGRGPIRHLKTLADRFGWVPHPHG